MIINSYDNRIKTPPEINNGPVLVEVAGYQPRNERIRQFMLAGERLVQARIDQYDYPVEEEGIENMAVDPTRNKSFDLADASQTMRNLEAKLQVAKDELKALEAAKASDSKNSSITDEGNITDPFVKGSQTVPEPPKGA